MPTPVISRNQLGFRADRGASFGISFLHDIVEVFKQDKSPVFVCSLDAQKCFDSIWHDGLFISLKVCYPMYIGYSCTDGILVLMQQ